MLTERLRWGAVCPAPRAALQALASPDAAVSPTLAGCQPPGRVWPGQTRRNLGGRQLDKGAHTTGNEASDSCRRPEAPL